MWGLEGNDMSRWRTWMCLSWMGLAAACGGGDEEEDKGGLRGTRIDCSWFQQDNCYKRALATVESCVDTGMGRFSADGTRCTYTTGTTVNFHKPVDVDGELPQDWDFEVVTNFGQCLAYQELEGEIRMETRDGIFSTELVGIGMQISCPDGSEFYVANAFDTLDCGFENLPGNLTSSSNDLMSFALLGGPNGDFVTVFSCSTP